MVLKNHPIKNGTAQISDGSGISVNLDIVQDIALNIALVIALNLRLNTASWK